MTESTSKQNATPNAKELAEMRASPAAFRERLVIDVEGSPRDLNSVLDDWQKEDFAALDAGWLQAATGKQVQGAKHRAYLERPRGHSKTSDLAIQVCWALAFSERTIRGLAAAGDKDQARLLRDAIETLVRLNPWLRAVITISSYSVRNSHTGSQLEILSSDAASSYGHLVDFLVVDELANWPDKGEAFWVAIVSTIAKRKRCLAVAISNAGFDSSGEGWQWKARETFRKSKSCYFHSLDGPRATWISEALLSEQRELLPEPAYRRLWLNEWTSGAGDAISESDLAEAFARGLGPMRGDEEGFEFCAGLDLSVSRDRSALVAVGKDESGRYRVARCKVWQPPKGGKIDQSQIEETIRDWNARFRFRAVLADPYQAEYLIERLRRQGVAMQGRPQTGRGLCEQASALLECFSGENIDVLNDARLEHDLRAARVVEKSYGWRIESPRDTHGHGDSLTALQLAVVAARAIVAMRIKLDVWQDDELNRAKQESLRERLLLGMPADAGSPKTHNAFLERFMQ